MTKHKPIWQADWLSLADDQVLALTQNPWLSSWLLETGSLTARLKQLGAFHLQLISEQQQELPVSLQQRWHCQYGTCREVLMSLAQQPVIYAQSFWPASTTAALAPLAQLGAMPLGEYIFAQPDLQRSPIEIAQLHVDAAVLAAGKAGDCFARRSFFSVAGHELLVQEVFLNDVLAADQRGQNTGAITA